MSVGGRNMHTGKSSNLRLLDDDERDKLITTARLSNAVPGTGKQPAQERLKRLQTQLKRVQDKKPISNNERERETIKRSTRSSSTSQISTPKSSPVRRSSIYASTPHRSLTERLKVQTKVAKSASPRNAWEKPKALVDASNRLKAGPSQSANQRLTQLRTSLQQKQGNEERNNNDVAKINKEVIGKEAKNCNITNSSAFKGSSSSEIEPEPMEWEESIEDEPPKKDQDEAEKEDDILLMRQAADGEELPTRLVDHMYFVLDTNVLMHNIKFVESLTEVVLPGTVGSMLYIPYIVIKELDKLKGQYQSDDPKRLVAVRAIRYLNTKFDGSLEIQGQSAVEEAEHLIKVDCPDDSIINCCLQLQEQVPSMMLLTNDENLRLKANASDIQVSCRSDLMSTYADEFAALGD
ncbi:transcriptional protein SWT1 isoform X1 [Drosophila santomea]|uniref:transcriptional protein SWT1 isoform X1 n=1 Tax=Drosophila santomea TaxID=129105 RepID=UPI0019531D9E|nr:transcriptional protein SWT1 isoform X1 [Drosophila santomea]XP_039499651.1 transcriptional protein SWT1 isoform X1 [Drosophila santomea]